MKKDNSIKDVDNLSVMYEDTRHKAHSIMGQKKRDNINKHINQEGEMQSTNDELFMKELVKKLTNNGLSTNGIEVEESIYSDES